MNCMISLSKTCDICLVSESEMLAMVKRLRQQVSTDIQPEIAPWAKEYTQRMEDIQTAVTISHNRKGKEMTQHVEEGYKGLFKKNLENNSDTTLLQSFSLKGTVSHKKGERILVRGGEGMGKSILCKQIEGLGKGKLFKFCYCVLCLREGDVIENVIIDQNLELGITPEKLQLVLERIGHKCLIILDGFSDVMIKDDSDLMKVVRGQKFSQCSVLVTLDVGSDLHSGYFETECEVQGFGFNPQKSLSKVVHSQSDLEEIIKWKPSVPIPGTASNQTNPMLAMFLCVLVNNKIANFENSTMTLNEVLSQLIGCLCRKYTSCDLTGVVRSVGKLAFDSLQFGRTLSKDDEDVSSLDQGVLASGLLTCHKSLVIFPQRIVQLHLAVLYFVQILNDGEEIDTLLGRDSNEPVFMRNTLFLHFGLELLSNQTYLPFQNRETIYHKLRTFFLKRISYVQLDLKDLPLVHPSLLSLAFQHKDENVRRFLRELLSRCTETKILHLSPHLPVGEILSAMRPVFKNLSSLYLGNSSEPVLIDVLKQANPDEFNVFIQSEPGFQELLDFLNASTRQYSLHYIGNKDSKPVIYLGKFAKPNVTKLFIHQTAKCCMVVGNDIECCTNLTHLSIFGKLSHPEHTMEDLSVANRCYKFPVLCHLRFAMTGGAEWKVKGKLGSMFNDYWTELKHLDVGKNILDNDDLGGLSRVKWESLVLRAPEEPLIRLPTYDLKKLHVIDPNGLFPEPECPIYITELSLSKVCHQSFNIVKFLETVYSLNALTMNAEQDSGNDWNLTKFRFISEVRSLDISDCPYRSSLCKLLCRKFPVLHSLVLSNCSLEIPDLLCLAQANVEGWLPMLRRLDISNNRNFGNLRDLFAFDSEWQTIGILRTEINEDVDRHNDLQFESLAEKVASGKMSCLKKLSFSTQKADYLPKHSGACWKQLRCLEISSGGLSCVEVLAPVVEQIEKERQSCHSGRPQMFPRLHTVTV